MKYVDKYITEETKQEMHNKALAKILRKIGGYKNNSHRPGSDTEQKEKIGG